jgi:4-hydroxy-2-oxoheptanedioate aldolase
MAINRAKRRMLEGNAAIGAEVGLGSPLSAEHLSRLGFDYVLVDNQHGRWDDDRTFQAFRSIGLGSAAPMARVRQNDFGAIGRLLDMGALGIVVPMVHNAALAEAAAFAMRYPPRGGRSGGAFGVDFHGGGEYMDWADDEVFLAVQIESAEGLQNADEIMAVEGVDGCWVGPADLGLSMGLDRGTPEGQKAHTEAIDSIFEACLKNKKVPGISAASVALAKPWLDKGGLFVTVGVDTLWVLDGAAEALRQLGRAS